MNAMSRTYASRLMDHLNVDADDLRDPRFYSNKVAYVASGTNNDVFRMTLCDMQLIVKIGYLEELTIDNIKQDGSKRYRDVARGHLKRDPCNVALRFYRMAQSLILRNICPHFVIAHRHCMAPTFLQRLGSKVPAKVQKKRVKQSPIHDITIMEAFDGDLQNLIGKQRLLAGDVRDCVFQVLYTLVVLQHCKPNLRHNDLHCGNVFIKYVPHLVRQSSKIQYVWQFEDEDHPRRWIFGTWPYFAAIADFDFLNFGDGEDNIKVSSNLFARDGIDTKQNRSYDSHLFTHSLACSLNTLVQTKKDEMGAWKELLDWLARPYGSPTYLLASDSRQRREDESLTPRALLTALFPTVRVPAGQLAGGTYLFSLGNVRPRHIVPKLVLAGLDLDSLATPYLLDLLRGVGVEEAEMESMIRSDAVFCLQSRSYFSNSASHIV